MSKYHECFWFFKYILIWQRKMFFVVNKIKEILHVTFFYICLIFIIICVTYHRYIWARGWMFRMFQPRNLGFVRNVLDMSIKIWHPYKSACWCIHVFLGEISGFLLIRHHLLFLKTSILYIFDKSSLKMSSFNISYFHHKHNSPNFHPGK